MTPRLVGEIGFSEWTSAGLLRHPRFLGLREAKPAREVRREGPIGTSQTARTPFNFPDPLLSCPLANCRITIITNGLSTPAQVSPRGTTSA